MNANSSDAGTSVVSSPLDNHEHALSPQTVLRVRDLRGKWLAANQALMDRVGQLTINGEGNEPHAEFLPEELCEPWDQDIKAELNAQPCGAQIPCGDKDYPSYDEPESGINGQRGELAGNVFQLQVVNIVLVHNGLGIGDFRRPGHEFQSVIDGSSVNPFYTLQKRQFVPNRRRQTDAWHCHVDASAAGKTFNSIIFCDLVRWFYPFCVPLGDAAVPPERVASVSGTTSHTIKDVS